MVNNVRIKIPLEIIGNKVPSVHNGKAASKLRRFDTMIAYSVLMTRNIWDRILDRQYELGVKGQGQIYSNICLMAHNVNFSYILH